jgi:hypothetical protein
MNFLPDDGTRHIPFDGSPNPGIVSMSPDCTQDSWKYSTFFAAPTIFMTVPLMAFLSFMGSILILWRAGIMDAMSEIVVATTCESCKKKFEVHVGTEMGYTAMSHAQCPSCGHALGPFPGKVLGIEEKPAS